MASPRSAAAAMRVTEFLTAIPAIGEGKRDRILAIAGEELLIGADNAGGGVEQTLALRVFTEAYENLAVLLGKRMAHGSVLGSRLT